MGDVMIACDEVESVFFLMVIQRLELFFWRLLIAYLGMIFFCLTSVFIFPNVSFVIILDYASVMSIEPEARIAIDT